MAVNTPESVPSFMGVPMKHISLVTVHITPPLSPFAQSEKPIVASPHSMQPADNGLVDIPKLSVDSRKSFPVFGPIYINPAAHVISDNALLPNYAHDILTSILHLYCSLP